MCSAAHAPERSAWTISKDPKDKEVPCRIRKHFSVSHFKPDEGILIVPVILGGGIGSRLWPVSQETVPKQFIPLIDERSTFQETLLRVSNTDIFEPPLVITHTDFRFVVSEQLRSIGIPADILLEPVRRDSAAAIVAATLVAGKRDRKAIILVLPSDHAIADVSRFLEVCREAASVARCGYITTFGVRPDRPSTGYGYLRQGTRISGANARLVAEFIEKPDLDTARKFVDSGYLWNSGNLMFRADVMLSEFRRYMPELTDAVENSIENAEHDADFIRLCDKSFALAPRISIDHAIMEKTSMAAVIPADIGWSDVGSWESVWMVSDKDGNG
ncbi:MAG TPA: hypothetical protein ENJ26_02235, partial [Rhodobacteraceae bacterium]|nr:hypothetical protein [Paracoccaceae bacterium]